MHITDIYSEAMQSLQADRAVAKQKHFQLVSLCETGVALILTGLERIGEHVVDNSTPENCSKAIAFRYFLSIPFKAIWALETLLTGCYSSSAPLLRVLYEETLSLEYFTRHPEIARDAFFDPGYSEPSPSRKRSKLGLDKNKGFKAIYNLLSADAHPKHNVIRGIKEADELFPEPIYREGELRLLGNILIFFIGSTVDQLLKQYLSEKGEDEWSRAAAEYLELTKEELPKILEQKE